MIDWSIEKAFKMLKAITRKKWNIDLERLTPTAGSWPDVKKWRILFFSLLPLMLANSVARLDDLLVSCWQPLWPGAGVKVAQTFPNVAQKVATAV